jgi:hypothetical protein
MADSDENKKKTGVPSWQLKPSGTSQDDQTEGQNTAPQPTPSRASIIEDARRFLLEDEVRNAPTDKQVAFLEGKGLESQEIQELLGVTRNTDATAPQPEVNSLMAAMKPLTNIYSRQRSPRKSQRTSLRDKLPNHNQLPLRLQVAMYLPSLPTPSSSSTQRNLLLL